MARGLGLGLPDGPEGGGIAGLFHIDHREIRVGGDGVGRVGVGGVVVGDVPGAGLLIGAQDQPDVVPHRQPQLLDAPHGKQGGQRRALVVLYAPAIDHIAVAHQGKGIGVPALADAHNVQMGQNVQQVRPVVQVDGAHIALVLAGGKAPAPGQLQGSLHRPDGALAKGTAGGGLPHGGVHGNESGQCLGKFILPPGHPGMDLFLQRHRISAPFPFLYARSFPALFLALL